MDRPNWYSDEHEPGSGGRFAPFRTWSLTGQLIAVMVGIFLVNVFTTKVSYFLALERTTLGNPLNWYQFVSYALVHAPHVVLHILFNCLLLYFFGRPVESLIGRRRYAWFCATAAVAGAAGYLLVEVLTGGQSTYLMGASGVVTAAMVMYALTWPNAQVLFIVITVKAWILVTILVAIDAYYGAVYLIQGSASGTAHFAHLGGALFGFLYFKFGSRVGQALPGFDGLVRGIKKGRDQARRKQATEKKQEIDRLLDKINREGLNSLSRTERRFLESASKDMRDR